MKIYKLNILQLLLLISTSLFSCNDHDMWDFDTSIYSKYNDYIIHNSEVIYLKCDDYKGGMYSLSFTSSTLPDNTASLYVYYCKDDKDYKALMKIPIEGGYSRTTCNLPPGMGEYQNLKIKILADTTVTISNFSFRELQLQDVLQDNKLVFHSHLGYKLFAPENSAAAFEFSGKSGYIACISNPIESRDGVIYCYHENHNTLYNPPTAHTFSLSADDFHGLYSDSISTFDAGYSTSRYWKDTPVCKLENYLSICKTYNMMPTFSLHPEPSENALKTIRALLDKYDLTSKLTIKAYSAKILNKSFEYFGNSIRSYVLMYNSHDFDNAITEMNKVKGLKILKGIESGFDYWTEKSVKSVLDAGYYVSSYSIGNDGEKLKTLIRWGVTEFTTDYFSIYSNWMDNKKY